MILADIVNSTGFDALSSLLYWVYYGSTAFLRQGFFVFKKDMGTDSKGALFYVASNITAYSDWLPLHGYSVGDKVNGGGESVSNHNHWCYWECTTAGTSDEYTLEDQLPGFPLGSNDGDTLVDGTVIWTYRVRLRITARNCYDIFGTSWDTEIMGPGIIPQVLADKTGDMMMFRFGQVVKGTGSTYCTIYAIVSGHGDGGVWLIKVSLILLILLLHQSL